MTALLEEENSGKNLPNHLIFTDQKTRSINH